MKDGGKKGMGGKGASAAKTCWNCGENGHLSSQCPKKNLHAVQELTTGQSGRVCVKVNSLTSRSIQVLK